MDTQQRGPSYGPHLIADIAGCNPADMRDGEFVYLLLQDLVKHVGMNPIGSPHLDLYSGVHKAWQGWSATAHIQTSHITAHFFAFGYVFLDIFSCRPFDLAGTKHYILSRLRPTGPTRFQLVERGCGFPHELMDPAQVEQSLARAVELAQ